MVGELSLQDILNVVATRPAIGQALQNSNKRTNGSGTTLTELDAFSALDPLLADLQKHYLDAKAQRLQSMREYGADDAMTDMAEWAEDSAWCAVQTRYMELRSDRVLMREAQALMWESEEEERAQTQIEREKESLKTFQHLQLVSRMHEAQKESTLAHWWALLWLLLSQPQDSIYGFYPAYQFNRMAA